MVNHIDSHTVNVEGTQSEPPENFKDVLLCERIYDHRLTTQQLHQVRHVRALVQ